MLGAFIHPFLLFSMALYIAIPSGVKDIKDRGGEVVVSAFFISIAQKICPGNFGS
ncbi:MAG: hypothetical protein OP8BY_0661 [Candidatus Saccharicenans subterraneus]|uniref:Uncharacterized protein n=1 Tax=Candidatus Saccharicenans subterraneus TaxID=2508984 RepID=A0A3E2BKN2_9BACT|nr:MAG: hypothetical protein OP8BY_0661 [Candidatus Saccharicenans subterraneum]